MSSLQCPARVFLARHGEAAYPVPGVMTDHGGWLTERGRAQAADLADELRGERLAAVYASPMACAAETGAIVAERLGLPSTVVPGLGELACGRLEGRTVDDPERVSCEDRWRSGDLGATWPGGESGTQVLARMRQALDEIADRHRGEAVLAVSHGGVMSLALGRLVSGAASPTLAVPPVGTCAVVALAGDAEGWRLTRPWPKSELGRARRVARP